MEVEMEKYNYYPIHRFKDIATALVELDKLVNQMGGIISNDINFKTGLRSEVTITLSFNPEILSEYADQSIAQCKGNA